METDGGGNKRNTNSDHSSGALGIETHGGQSSGGLPMQTGGGDKRKTNPDLSAGGLQPKKVKTAPSPASDSSSNPRPSMVDLLLGLAWPELPSGSSPTTSPPPPLTEFPQFSSLVDLDLSLDINTLVDNFLTVESDADKLLSEIESRRSLLEVKGKEVAALLKEIPPAAHLGLEGLVNGMGMYKTSLETEIADLEMQAASLATEMYLATNGGGEADRLLSDKADQVRQLIGSKKALLVSAQKNYEKAYHEKQKGIGQSATPGLPSSSDGQQLPPPPMRLVGIRPRMEEMDKLRDAPAQWSIRLLAIESEMSWLENQITTREEILAKKKTYSTNINKEIQEKIRHVDGSSRIKTLELIIAKLKQKVEKLKGDKNVQTSKLIRMACALKTGNSSMDLIREHGKLALNSREADGFLKKMQQRLENYKRGYEDCMAKKNNEASLKTV